MPVAVLGILTCVFIALLTVALLGDENFIVQLRGVLDMIGWYNSDKKKGWRLVQDGNKEFNLQKFNFGTFTWDTFEHFADEEDALNRYNCMNDIWQEEIKDLENDKKALKAQKKYESNAKKVKKVIR
jgi:hypothetical protein